MKLLKVLCLMLVFLGPASAGRAADPGQPQTSAESLTAWEWFEEITLPAAGSARYSDFVLTPSVFANARRDLGDLRLVDGAGREVPYALRIRRTEDKNEPLPVRQFNKVTNPDRSTQLSLDLGEKTGEHNAIDFLTSGSDFRRRVRLEGSENAQTWSSVLDNSYLIRFQVGNQLIDVHTLQYPVSRLRYLRVTVFAESGNEKDRPEITSAVVYRSIMLPGEYVTLPAHLRSREPVRAGGGLPGSAWLIDFGGESVPCEKLLIDVADNDFVRPYALELADRDEPVRQLASGEWRRRAGSERKPVEVQFPEVMAERLRLGVTDYANPPLTLRSVEYSAPARQVIFARSQEVTMPLRLYFGNPKAEPPHFDFAANLPDRLEPPPSRAKLEALAANPSFQPTPKPWSERWPWLVYLVLSSASLVLLVILGLLGRGAIRKYDAGERSAGVVSGSNLQ